ncbi:hypothetical protein BLNAU_5965 [Blattamonas nauphoetae]|uniref:Suppressor of anucleate metulae protein B n=1 Tax=Blattamonas nauphoetae TaxID=2049346 RepID=A0ABQ9Y610_9EUKA|nr:hypothetical protein BLNAU_5965 [Blattamonas nauphoetae]
MQKQTPLFTLAETEKKGRCVVAVCPIQANTIILCEPSIATVMYTTSRTSFCAYCTDSLPNTTTQLACPDCKKIFYCSKKCFRADQLLHKFECRAYKSARAEFIQDSDAVHLLRMMSVFAYNEAHSTRLYSDSFPSLPPFNTLTPLQKLFDLTGHEGSFTGEYETNQRPICEEALSYLKYQEVRGMFENVLKYGLHENRCTICGKSRHTLPGQARHVCLRKDSAWKTQWSLSKLEFEAITETLICSWESKHGKRKQSENEEIPLEMMQATLVPLLISAQSIADCNAHTIFRDTGFGLFHMGSMFNHACCPNSAFCHDRRGRIIVVTLRPIRTAEEITVDYSELCIAMDRRQKELKGTYHFDCRCPRCVRTTLNRLGSGTRNKTWAAVVRAEEEFERKQGRMGAEEADMDQCIHSSTCE